MLSIFSCASWPCVCLLWRNVCLGLLPIFWLGFLLLLFLLLSCMICLCILEMKPLSVTSFVNIFSRPVGCLLILFMVSFAVQKLLSLIRPHLFIFYFHYSSWWVKKKLLLQFMSKNILPMFSSKSFPVSGLTLRSLTHFEFILVYDVRFCSNFIFLHVAVQFS